MRRYYNTPRFLYHLLRLRRNVRLELTRLVKMQEKKLRKTIRHAYDNISFYHGLFKDNNIHPDEIKTAEDLKKIPVVTREMIQRNSSKMTSKKVNIANCSKHKTSGSSGVPINVYSDNRSLNYKSAISLRQFLECGGQLRDRQAQLRGPGAAFNPKSHSRPLYEYLKLLRTEWFTQAEITDGYVTFLETYKPEIMVGYPSLFEILAEKSNGARARINPRIIFCTGEILSRRCRELMRSSFGAKIIDSYGCTEAGDIAWECPEEHSGYHINLESVLVEFVKDGENVSAGEEGEIILTTLFNGAQPFIRYKIGDVGVPSEGQCACGRTLPLMQLIKGRSDDFISLPNGKRLSPMSVLNSKNFFELTHLRVVQERMDLITVWLKMDKGYTDASVKRSIAALQHVVGDDVEVRPLLVDEIPKDDSGKLRRIISRVAN